MGPHCRRGEKAPSGPYNALFIVASLQSAEMTIADVHSEQGWSRYPVSSGNDGLLNLGREVPLMSEKFCGGRIAYDEHGDEPGH